MNRCKTRTLLVFASHCWYYMFDSVHAKRFVTCEDSIETRHNSTAGDFGHRCSASEKFDGGAHGHACIRYCSLLANAIAWPPATLPAPAALARSAASNPWHARCWPASDFREICVKEVRKKERKVALQYAKSLTQGKWRWRMRTWRRDGSRRPCVSTLHACLRQCEGS